MHIGLSSFLTHPHPRHQTAWGAIRPCHPHHLPPPPWVPRHPGLLVVIDAIQAMDGQKPPVPSSGLPIQVRTVVLVLDTSQCMKGLVKELIGPRGDAHIPRQKEGSNGHEEREVRKKAQQRRLQLTVTGACLEQVLQRWMIFRYDWRDTTNSEHHGPIL